MESAPGADFRNRSVGLHDHLRGAHDAKPVDICAGDNVRTGKEKSPRSPNKVPKFVLSGKGCGAVSYTHLDVYKRQTPWSFTVA